MRNFIAGTIFGVLISTVGFSGIARMLDNGIQKTKDIAVETAK